MEILIIIGAIIFIAVKSIVKFKQQQDEIQGKCNNDCADEINRQERNFQGVNRPNAEGYNELKKEPLFYESAEGSESNEGKCIEENPAHCVVEHSEDSIYATEIGNENNDFTREDFVKGIIMAEILSKPKSMQ